MINRKPKQGRAPREPHPDPVIESMLQEIDTLERHIAGREQEMRLRRDTLADLEGHTSQLGRKAGRGGYSWHTSQMQRNEKRARAVTDEIRQLEEADLVAHKRITKLRLLIREHENGIISGN